MARPSKMQLEMNAKAEAKYESVKEVYVAPETTLIDELMARITALEELVTKKETPKGLSLNKFEGFNREQAPELPVERSMGMNDEDKLISMTNAVKILPPNMLVEGRHSKENIGAICGFMITDEMLDAVYSNFKHDED